MRQEMAKKKNNHEKGFYLTYILTVELSVLDKIYNKTDQKKESLNVL